MIERSEIRKIIIMLFLMWLLIFPFLTSTQASEEQVTATWTNMEVDVPSHPSDNHNGVIYDSESDRVIYIDNEMQAFAYDYNKNLWENMSAPSSKRTVTEGTMAYDSESDILIHFGGYYQYPPETGPYTFYSETFAFDYNTNTWTNLTTENGPTKRSHPNMAYDSESDRIIMYGGAEGDFIDTEETWAYDYNTNTWTKMNPANNPSLRAQNGYIYRVGLTYDVESDRIILFAGGDEQKVFSDTWSYDYNSNTWEKMNPSVSPNPRKGIPSAMAYDVASDRVIVFGGFNPTISSDPYNDTWTYDYNTNTWTEVNFDIHPAARNYHLMAYDEESDKMILFAGTSAYDTWSLDYKPNTPDAPQKLAATSENGKVALTWEAPTSNGGSDITNYIIYRGTTSGELTELVKVSNILNRSDADVIPGDTYYYAVSAMNTVGEGSKSNEVSVTVSTTTTTAATTPLDLAPSVIVLWMLAGLLICNRKNRKK